MKYKSEDVFEVAKNRAAEDLAGRKRAVVENCVHRSQFKNSCFAEMFSGSEEGS